MSNIVIKTITGILFSYFYIWLSSLSCVALPLSPSDVLQISIPDDEYFVGLYKINQDGDIEIPFLGSIPVAGKEPFQIENQLHQALVDRGFFLDHNLQLSIEIIEWGAIQVTVSGETFQPGRILIAGGSQGQSNSQLAPTQRVKGDYPLGRYLTNAIRVAGGVLPTADITEVQIIRENQEITVDLSGILTGERVEDIPLIDGDSIIVPKSDVFQPELVRPSQITPPGIKVFVSNLTIPANSNSSSAISNLQEGISLPYGARFSHAAIATNCTGGTKGVNAGRKAILVRANRITGETTFLEKDVEELIRNSQNNQENPLLMPNDAVACYDSHVSNARDIFRTIADFLSPLDPILLFRNLLR